MGNPITGVWVIADQNESGILTDGTLQALSAASTLAGQRSQSVTAVLVSDINSSSTQQESLLAQYGADQVLLIRHDSLFPYQVEAIVQVLTEVIQQYQPSVVLAPSGSKSRDFIPRLAICLSAALYTECVSLEWDTSDRLVIERPILGENLISRRVSNGPVIAIATLKAKAFEKKMPDASKTANVEILSPDLSAFTARVRRTQIIQAQAEGGKRIEDVPVVIAGGRGLKSAENFKLLEELASVMGGAVGSTRAVVDAGWRPYAEQIGQTGKTVSPAIYIAAGISGAIQHLVGMNTSKLVVAINKDSDAAIMESADLAITGDALQIIPALTRKLQQGV